jgi:hypothetical protein
LTGSIVVGSIIAGRDIGRRGLNIRDGQRNRRGHLRRKRINLFEKKECLDRGGRKRKKTWVELFFLGIIEVTQLL